MLIWIVLLETGDAALRTIHEARGDIEVDNEDDEHSDLELDLFFEAVVFESQQRAIGATRILRRTFLAEIWLVLVAPNEDIEALVLSR